MNGQIFISYRRNDTRWFANNLYKALQANFPKEKIFMDIDNIPYGEDFIDIIEKAVGNSDALLAIIGKEWLNIKDKKGQRMIDNPNDFVRIEIASALKNGVKIFPVLVDDAPPPEREELPDDLKPLSRRNALEVSYTRFNSDVDKLIKVLHEVFETKRMEGLEQEKREKELKKQRDEQNQRKKAEEQKKRQFAEERKRKAANEKIKADIEKARQIAEGQKKSEMIQNIQGKVDFEDTWVYKYLAMPMLVLFLDWPITLIISWIVKDLWNPAFSSDWSYSLPHWTRSQWIIYTVLVSYSIWKGIKDDWL